jgi:hypothetical protein
MHAIGGMRYDFPPNAYTLCPDRQEEAMTPPETRYARSGEVDIAYQVFGAAPFDQNISRVSHGPYQTLVPDNDIRLLPKPSAMRRAGRFSSSREIPC